MKTIKYMVALIITIIILDVIFNMVFQPIYQNTLTGESGGKINNYQRTESTKVITMLTMGNSRCGRHIIPNKLSPTTFNLSHNGMSLTFQTGLFDQLVKTGKNHPDTVLLHIEPFEISANHSEDLLYLKEFYRENSWIQFQTNKHYPFEQIKQLFSSYKWNGKVLSTLNNWLKTRNGQIQENGYIPNLPSKRDSINVTWSVNKDKSSADGIPAEIDESFQEYLVHFKDICEKKGITLICFTSPYFDKPNGLGQNSTAISNILKAQSIPYLDYQSRSIADLRSIWLWKDNFHLNHNGALIFTQQIRHDLDSIRRNRTN